MTGLLLAFPVVVLGAVLMPRRHPRIVCGVAAGVCFGMVAFMPRLEVAAKTAESSEYREVAELVGAHFADYEAKRKRDARP